MDYTAKVASSVIFVPELDRSVDFYEALFGCKVALREAGGVLLLAPDGFQIYLITKGPHEPHPTGGIGDQHLMWATDSVEALDHFEQLLKDLGCYTYTHSAGEVALVEDRDPDGLRVVIAHPSPLQLPRSVLDARLYS